MCRYLVGVCPGVGEPVGADRIIPAEQARRQEDEGTRGHLHDVWGSASAMRWASRLGCHLDCDDGRRAYLDRTPTVCMNQGVSQTANSFVEAVLGWGIAACEGGCAEHRTTQAAQIYEPY